MARSPWRLRAAGLSFGHDPDDRQHAPLVTLLAYLPTVNGNVSALLSHEGRAQGVVLITLLMLLMLLMLLIAPAVAPGALYRQRDAQARNQALSFELEKSRLAKQALDAQLNLLHAQIEPHFLFNTPLGDRQPAPGQPGPSGLNETAELALKGRDELLPVSRSFVHLFRQM